MTILWVRRSWDIGVELNVEEEVGGGVEIKEATGVQICCYFTTINEKYVVLASKE